MTWIGACLVAAFLLGTMLGSVFSRQREDTQRDQSHAHKLDYPAEANQEASIAALARAQIALAKDANAVEKRQSSYNKRSHRISFWTAVGVGTYTVFTAVIVVLGVIQYGETHRFDKKQITFLNAQLTEMRGASQQTDQTIAALKGQADIMRGQLEVSRNEFTATQRPWISLDSKPVISSLYFNPGGDISFNVQFILANSGRTPAIHVFPHVDTVLMTKGNLLEIINRITPFCEKWKHLPFSQTESGVLIPPGKTISYPSYMAAGVTKEEIQMGRLTVRDRAAINPYIGGCIDY